MPYITPHPSSGLMMLTFNPNKKPCDARAVIIIISQMRNLRNRELTLIKAARWEVLKPYCEALVIITFNKMNVFQLLARYCVKHFVHMVTFNSHNSLHYT